MRRYRIPISESSSGSAAWVLAVVILSTGTVTLTIAFPVDVPLLQNLLSLPVSAHPLVYFDLPPLHLKKRSLTIRSPTTNSHEVSSAAKPLPDLPDTPDDSCTGKEDKYYPNFSSNCTSYYFCTTGYQTTYLCDPGLRFNGVKCTPDYGCPQGRAGVNPCATSPNGYYASFQDPTKYFYCYHKSKVIELRCSGGKVYDEIQKKCLATIEGGTPAGWEVSGCGGKGNGFYPDLQSGCAKYYYCIEGVQTQLECQGGLVFNGDICVQEGSFKCPQKSP